MASRSVQGRCLWTAYTVAVVTCGVAIWFVHGTAKEVFANTTLVLAAAVLLFVIWRPKRRSGD